MGTEAKGSLAITQDTSSHSLVEAFENFSQASARLERNYELLQAQVMHLTKQLELKEQEVKRAQKLATLGETAAAMAHEIRNPLGAMKLFLSLLKDDLSDRPESIELIQQMEKSMGTLNHVVSNILQFSRKHETPSAPINIGALIREQIEYIEAEHPQLFIEFEVAGNPFVRASEHGMRQVLNNVLMNAVQGMKGEGDICIGISEGLRGEMVIRIDDSGPGIPEHLLPDVFEPFVTSKNEGTGLGLAVVKQIIEEQHGGRVGIENKIDEAGVVVTISLPRSSLTIEKIEGSSHG